MKPQIKLSEKQLTLKIQDLSTESISKILNKIEQEYSMNGSCKDWYCTGHNKTHKK